MNQKKYVYVITKSEYIGHRVVTITAEVRSTRDSAKTRLAALEDEDECGTFEYSLERMELLD